MQYEGMEGTPRVGILIGEARNWQRKCRGVLVGVQVRVRSGAVPYRILFGGFVWVGI